MSVLHRALYYTGAPSGYVVAPCHDWLIAHYAEAVAPDPTYFDQLKALKPDFPCFSYTSVTDDYTQKADGSPHPDGVRVAAAAAQLGVPIETMYLHWAEDTVVTVWVSGPGPTPKFYPAGQRIEMYLGGHQSGGQLRECCSFVPAAQPVQTEVHKQIARLVSPGGREWDGLFLDNASNFLGAWGDPLVSGGTVLECGLKINTAAFRDWYWHSLRDWMAGFRTEMESMGKILVQNVASYWSDDYCNFHTCDRIFLEFVGNPIRDSWPPVNEVWRRNQLAHDAGIGAWYSTNPALGSPAETYREMQYGALCLHLATMSPSSSTHIQDWTGPYGMKPGGPTLDPPTWPDRVVSPVEANHQFGLLGTPTGPVELVETRGPTTRQQHLWRRMFERGAVYVRNLEPWNGLTSETWDVPVGPQMIVVGPDGTNSKPASVSIKNGGGAILWRA